MANAAEVLVRKNLSDFCKILPGHVEQWKAALQGALPVVRGVTNRAEQLRLVGAAKIKYMEDFEQAKKTLEYNIMTGIEEDMILVRGFIEKINKLNQLLRNKLTQLEASTLNLNWDDDGSELIRGTWSIPSLSLLLQSSLEFWTFFHGAYKNITQSTKDMNWLDEKSMRSFEKAFCVNLDVKPVNYLIAITQFVDNETCII